MRKEKIVLWLAVLALIAVLSVLCTGCIITLLGDIPDHEFQSFEYVRGGNVSSASIRAEDAKRTGDALVIKSLSIEESWPGFTATMKIKGYRRDIKKDAESADKDAVDPTTLE